MKKSLCIAVIIFVLTLLCLPLAWREVDSGKESFTVTQEVLSGNPDSASGITIRTASHWDGHLLWDTAYTIGSGEEAQNTFRFSGRGTDWVRSSAKAARAFLRDGDGFGSCETEGEMGIDPRNMPFPELVEAAAERTEAGTVHTETVPLGDYYEYYPVEFEIGGSSVEYEGYYEENLTFLTDLFQIGTAQDKLEITIEKDAQGNLRSVSGQKADHGQNAIMISEASTFGGSGCYYAFCVTDMGTGKRVHRGENSGIFYLPFTEEDGWITVSTQRLEKVCGLPEEGIPVGMLLEEEEGRLYLAVKEENDYSLIVHSLEGGMPVFTQRVPLGQERLFAQGGPAGDEDLPEAGMEIQPSEPQLRSLTQEDGGLLLTWSDNGFSFVTDKAGQCRLWCSGVFPQKQEEGEGWYSGGRYDAPFPEENQCFFDGERLALAAFEERGSLNVLLAVYDPSGELYSGRYRHSGGEDLQEAWQGSGLMQDRIVPQGVDSAYYTDLFVYEWPVNLPVDGYRDGRTGEEIRPLELTGQAD